MHNTLADDCDVFVLQYLQNTVADVTAVVVALQYLHNTSTEVATVVGLCDSTIPSQMLQL
jgi:hypothetical protein